MAKTTVDELLRFTVVINGDPAQKELYGLEKRNKALRDSTKDLKKEKALLEAQEVKNIVRIKELSAEITKNNKEVKENASRMRELQKEIGVTGLTLRQLGQRASFLRLQLATMLPKNPDRARLENELKQINTQISELSINSRAAQGSLSKLANGFNKYAALGASIIATGTGMILSVQKMIDYNGKLADAQSNVQKTTKLTAKEVDELSVKFGMFKTRTARIELLQLAEEAGRLGKEGVDDVLNFVKVANQIKVALGDDLGDEQIREVGKMVSIYKVGEREGKNFEESMLALGSSINEVSASGANQASFLVDFIKRTAGISDVANISAQDMIGLAAAFDEAGQSQEISATAINKTYGSMADESEKFAKIAGLSAKEFSKVLEEDANEALILFLKGLKVGNPTLEEMTARLKGIELGGTRGSQAISALAANVENLESKQVIANDSLKAATSLTEEYNLKNNNLAASLDKIQKKIYGIFSSESVVEGLNDFVEWFGKFIGASDDADGSVTRFRNRLVALLKAVLVITVAIVSYRTAVQLATIWTSGLDRTTRLYIITQKVAVASTTALRAATLLMSAVFNLATLNITRARAAMVLFNRTLLFSPIGLLVAAIGAAVAAYYLFSDASEKAVTSQKLLNSAMAEADKQTAKTISNKKLLLDIARDEKISLQQRQEAIDELNKTVPEYNGQLSLSTVHLEENTKKLDLHIESLKKSAVAYVLQERIKAKAVELADLENSGLEQNIEWYEKLWNTVKAGGNTFVAHGNNMTTAVKNKYALVDATKEEIKILEELYKTQLKNNPEQSVGSGPKEGDTKIVDGKTFVFSGGQWKLKRVNTPTGGSAKKSTKIDEAQKEADALLKLQRETEDQKLALIKDAFAREMAINDVNQKRKVEDLYAQGDKMLQAYDKALTSGNTDLASTLLNQYHEVLDQIEVSELNHHKKRTEILTKGVEDRLKSSEEEYKKQEQLRQIAHNNALAMLGNDEEAKKALQEQFDKDKLERQKANQEELKKELQKVLDTSNFEGFNLDLLSDEQLNKIKENLQELGLSISEVNVLLGQMQGKDTGGDAKAKAELAGLGIDPESRPDVLGMNDQEWEKIFERTETLAGAIAKVALVAQAAMQAFAMYDQFVTASEDKKLQRLERNADREKEKQASLLRNGLISQKQHDDAVAAQEDKVRKAKAEMEYKQAKRQKQMNIASVLANTAVAISQALAQGGFVLGIPWAAIVGAMGAIQLAAAVAQPLPAKGFEKGYYGNTMAVRREQDGKLFNAGFGGESRSGEVSNPTVFLAGEGGKNFPELIINGPDLKQFDPDLKNSLYRELGRIRGFESGYGYNKSSDTTTANNERPSDALLIAVLQQNAELLSIIKEEGIEAYLPRTFTNAKRMRDDIKKLEKLENKSKINA